MAYTVIKTVKGRKYMYMQESYRQGGKVLTKSRYLGAVDSATGEVGGVSVGSSEFIEKYQVEIRDRILVAGDPRRSRPEEERARREHEVREKARNAARGAEKGGKNRLDVRINCSRHKISAYALEEDYKGFQKRLQRFGVSLPSVVLKYGFRLRLYQTEEKEKGKSSSRFVVSVPRFVKVSREYIRREYRRALARASLAAIQKEKPEAYAGLSLHFDRSFFETQKLLNRFILSTNEKDALMRAAALKYFGVLHPIASGKLKPSKLGIIEYGKRKTWEDEAASLMVDCHRRGWSNVYSEAMAEERKAQNSTHFIALDKKQWGIRKKRALKRAEIRVLLNREKQEKLKILRKIFRF